jgi:hypothetical protein
MFGIPGEVLWPTAAMAALITVVFGGIALLKLLPHSRSRTLNEHDRDALDDLQTRVGQLDQLQQRVGELEERVDFAERLLAKQREERRLPPAEE